jgi:hypothetical protein
MLNPVLLSDYKNTARYCQKLAVENQKLSGFNICDSEKEKHCQADIERNCSVAPLLL